MSKLSRSIHVLLWCFLWMLPILSSAQNNVGPGNALDLNGTSDYVDLGSSFNTLTFPFTVTAWVKTNQSSTINNIFSSCNTSSSVDMHGVWMHIRDNQVDCGVGAGANGNGLPGKRVYRATLPHSYGEWIHVVGVFRGVNDIDIYFNGVLLSGTYVGSGTALVNSTTGTAAIGKHYINFDRYYDGEIDNFTLWNRSLTQAEIRDMMCKKIDPSASGLVLAFDFNESSSATTFTNLVTGGVNGTRQGATTVTSSAPVGDVSSYLYHASTFPASPSTSVTRTLSGKTLSITGLTAPTKGVQVYRIDADPSIPAGCYDSDVYGVFLCETDFTSSGTFDLSIQNDSIGQKRNDFASSWTAASPNLTNQTLRVECVISLSGGYAQLLPNDTIVCPGSPLALNLPSSGSYTWSDGSTSNTNMLYPNDTLWVIDSSGICPISDTVVGIMPPGYTTDFGVDTLVCPNQTVLVTMPPGNFYWSDGSAATSRNFSAGTYLVIGDFGGCIVYDTVKVQEINVNSDFIQDGTMCQNGSFTFSVSGGQSYQWDDGSTNSSRTITAGGTYWVTVDVNGCSVTDTAVITEMSMPVFPYTDTVICLPTVFTLPSGQNFTWADGTTGAKLLQPDMNYTVIWDNGTCVDSVVISTHAPQNVDALVFDDFYEICEGDALAYSIPASVQNVLWSDGSTAQSRTITTAGTYSFTGQYYCDTVEVEFNVDVSDCSGPIIFIPNAFTPNGDGLNEYFEIANLYGVSFKLMICDRWGNIVFESTDHNYMWDGRYQGDLVQLGSYTYQLTYYNYRGNPIVRMGMINVIY